MLTEYEKDLEGTREMAVGAKHRIQQYLQTLEDLGHNDVNIRQFQCILSVLKSICLLSAKTEGKNYDIYCNILVHVLAKYVDPTVNVKHWKKYLELVRYFHRLIADKKLFTDAAMICDHIAGYHNYLQNESDYKEILGIYVQHLLSQHSHMRVNSSLAQEQTSHVLDALKELFRRMLHCNKSVNFSYPDLVTDFVQCLVPKRVSTVFNYLATLPANKTQMYDSFFVLLSELSIRHRTKEELHIHCQRHLEALTVFFQLDIPDRLQQQLALRHLRACRDMPLLKYHKSTNYVFTLLYYLVKLVYGLPNPGEFKDVYKDLSEKLTTFLDRYGDMLMQERWFADVPVVIALLLTHVQQHPSTAFVTFWQQMTSIECYLAHYELILCCIRLSPRIVETKLLMFDCCTSARKHTIISFLISSLAAYASYALACDESTSSSEDLFVSLRTQLLLIMRQGVSVLNSLACITPESSEMKLIYGHFVQIACDVRTPAQIRLCITLAEFLLRIRHKFSNKDWTFLLRRLYKMTLQIDDMNLTTDLHVAYITSILHQNEWPDLSQLRNGIGYFHTTSPHIPSGQCVLQLALETHSPFKVYLETPQKHLLHWLETQHFLKYQKSNEPLQITLMKCSQSQYNEVIVARGAGNLAPAVACRLRQMKCELHKKINTTSGLTRLEHLCLAHIHTALLSDALKQQKQYLVFDMKCQEDNLEELFQRKELATVTVANEVQMLKKANTALHGFQQFYENADTEPIVNTHLYIDWEAIVEDLASLALYLQFSGYINAATEAWILHYRITNTIDDQYNSLRSLHYFCEHSEQFLTPERSIDLHIEITRKQQFLLDAVKQLSALSKRFQNDILMCLCQLAHFYACNGHLSYAQTLLEMVQQAHAELPEQQGKYNLVLGTMDVVKFRILWKNLGNDQVQGDTQLIQLCLLREMEETLDRFRGDFFKLANSERMSYTILLIGLIMQVAECAANRLCDHFVNAYFSGVFRILLQFGAALRIIQLLAMWSWINLQMEYVNKAQIKMKLIEYIVGVKSLEDLRQMSEEAAAEKKLAMQSFANLELLHSGMEPLRKMVPPYASPINTTKMQLSPLTASAGNLNRFLCYQGSETFQEHEILEWCYFMVGCLNARLYFLAENHEHLEDFYETSNQWLQEHQQNALLLASFQNVQLLSFQHYANYLRAHKKYEKALIFLKSALHKCTKMGSNVDTVYRINLLLQLRGTEIEMSQREQSGNHTGLRRTLLFNFPQVLDKSKGETLSAGTAITPSVTASARKKLTIPAFEIYSSNRRTPEQPLKRSCAVRSIKKIERPPRTLETRTELKTPATAKNVSTIVTVRKLRGLRGAADDSGSNSSNSTPESSMSSILNQCQRIESVDLLDSDDDRSKKQMPNVIAGKVPSHREDILNICQKIDSIDLVDDDEANKVTCDSPAPTKQTNKVYTPKFVEISDDTTDFKTPESTIGKPALQPKISGAKKTARKAPKPAQGKRKNKEKNTNDTSADVSTCAMPTFESTSTWSDDGFAKFVEKIIVTEDTKSTITKSRTRTKTEVQTLKVITKEKEIKILSPTQQKTIKTRDSKKPTATGTGTRATRGRPRAASKVDPNNYENVAPSVPVSRTLGRRVRQ